MSHMREISLLRFGYYFVFFFFVFQRDYSRGVYRPTMIFTQNTSKDTVPRKDLPFRGLETKI